MSNSKHDINSQTPCDSGVGEGPENKQSFLYFIQQRTYHYNTEDTKHTHLGLLINFNTGFMIIYIEILKITHLLIFMHLPIHKKIIKWYKSY